MNKTIVLVILSVVVGVVSAWLVSCGKPMTIEGELAKAPEGDRQALDALLQGTGLTASQLTPIGAGVARGFGVLQHHERAVAVEDGRIRELRLSGVPLPHPEALTKLTGLQALWLSDNHLISLPDLSPLKELVFLDLGQNQVHDLAFLSALAKLTALHLAGNGLQSVANLASLAQLTDLDITGNPNVVIPNPKPEKWVLKTDANPTGRPQAPPHPANWVEAPPRKGKAGSGSQEGFVQGGSYSVKGTVATLTGAIDNARIPGTSVSGGAGNSTVEISVEKGRVRAYLQYVPPSTSFATWVDGYVYAEAEPGKPGSVKGILPAFGTDSYSLVIESVDGEATGIKFHVFR
jgi:hypothetical protein